MLQEAYSVIGHCGNLETYCVVIFIRRLLLQYSCNQFDIKYFTRLKQQKLIPQSSSKWFYWYIPHSTCRGSASNQPALKLYSVSTFFVMQSEFIYISNCSMSSWINWWKTITDQDWSWFSKRYMIVKGIWTHKHLGMWRFSSSWFGSGSEINFGLCTLANGIQRIRVCPRRVTSLQKEIFGENAAS